MSVSAGSPTDRTTVSATGRTTLPTVSVTREPARSADDDIRATSVRAARCFCRGCRASCGFRGFRSDSGFGCDFCGFRDSWSDSSFWKNSGSGCDFWSDSSLWNNSGCDFRFWFGCGRGRGFRSVELPAGCPARWSGRRGAHRLRDPFHHRSH
ncbi:hypothetical protein AB0L42_04240 [Streptomyces sp. NPDC052287]|uniref:hypothetical protein n=1 Tax=Streptomyces sp. NPDC052287 TaxID=3154950 RepID=UPI00341E9A17